MLLWHERQQYIHESLTQTATAEFLHAATHVATYVAWALSSCSLQGEL